jgi:hypothetical protein
MGSCRFFSTDHILYDFQYSLLHLHLESHCSEIFVYVNLPNIQSKHPSDILAAACPPPIGCRGRRKQVSTDFWTTLYMIE